MFGKRLTLFRLLGFDVRVDPSWLLLAVLITWTLAAGVFPTQYEGLSQTAYWLMGLGGLVGLGFSIVFHEFSHSLVARTQGLPIGGITLFIFGGVAEMTDEPPSPKAEFLMAIAGPLASVFLGLVFGGLALAGESAGLAAPATGVLRYLGLINFILAGFNMVPAFPLDGGRVLRSILWGAKRDIGAATRVTSRLGSAFGTLLIVLGVVGFIGGNFIGGAWWFLIGMFLRGAAASSYQQLVARQLFAHEPVRRYMIDRPVSVPPDVSVQEFIDGYVYRYHHDFFPVAHNGTVEGCVTLKAVKDMPHEEWARRTVHDIVVPCSEDNVVTPDTDALKALSLMHRTGNSRLLVTEGGRLVGIVTLKDMLRFLSLKLDLEGKA